MKSKIFMMISVCLLYLIGCSKETLSVVNEDPLIITHQLEGYMDALLEGELEYDRESKCFYITSGGRQDKTLPIWPKGTKLYEKNGLYGVKIPSYGTFLEGDALEAGGGGIEETYLETLNISSKCLETENIFAINKGVN